MRPWLTVVVCLACGSAYGQPIGEPRLLDAERLARFAEEVIPREMARRHIPGAVVVVVDAGQVALARGFGLANLDQGRPVDPARTVFRLASVSKTITATAALQLVERQRLSLTQDVNERLAGVAVPRYAKRPVTLHHLLTHTAGFDERLTGVAARRAEDLEALAPYLARTLPPRFAEAGQIISYSNHGMSLVGLLVQEASGQRFEHFVRDEIFGRLGMSNSGALTGALPAELAVAYDWDGTTHRALEPEYLQIGPAGMFYTTATDMARFLIAHLEGGAFEDRRILKRDTVARMHARQFAQHPAISGWGYGFWEDVQHEPRAVMHNGGGKGYRALMYLIPERRLGVFLAYNLADRHEDGELLDVFIRQFRQAFVPPLATSPARPPAFAATHADRLAGEYRYVRRARTGLESLIGLMNSLNIAKGSDGHPHLRLRALAPGPLRMAEIDQGVFRLPEDLGTLAVVSSPDGRVTGVVIDRGGFPTVYDRVPWMATVVVQVLWVVAVCIGLVYGAAFGVVCLIRRLRSRPMLRTLGPTPLESATSTLNLLAIVTIPLASFGRIEGGLPEFAFGTPFVVQACLYLLPLTGVLALASAYSTWRAWRAHGVARGLAARTVVAAALLGFTAFVSYWELWPGF